MIDDFIKMFGGMIDASKNQSLPKKPTSTWKHCVVLAAAGWKATSIVKTKEEFNNDLIITWTKEGKKDLEMRLPFSEQCLWFEYLKRREKQYV